MNNRIKNIAILRRIARTHGLVVAVTNSRRHGNVISIRVYANEEDKGHPDRALYSYGSYVNQKELARLQKELARLQDQFETA